MTQNTSNAAVMKLEEAVVLSDIEHVLERVDMYLGCKDPVMNRQFVLAADEKHMELREVTTVVALMQLLKEILGNVADNAKKVGRGTDRVWVTITSTTVTVKCNGSTIPVIFHPAHRAWLPTVLTTFLRSSTNYRTKRQNVIGANGLGAKCVPILSLEHQVDIQDKVNLKSFSQKCTDNMTNVHQAVVKDVAKSSCGNFMRVAFTPDLARFGNTTGAFTQDTLDAMKSMVFRFAAVSGLLTFFNGSKVPTRTFKSHAAMFNADPQADPVEWITVGPKNHPYRWEVAVIKNRWTRQRSGPRVTGLSVVNGVQTVGGGTHVDAAREAVWEAVSSALSPKIKGTHMKALPKAKLMGELLVFVKAQVPDASLAGQNKSKLLTPKSQFPITVRVPKGFGKRVCESMGLGDVLDAAMEREFTKMVRQAGAAGGRGGKKRRVVVENYDSANHAGGPHSQSCTLILTEGNSAKALAVSGMSVVGRDRYGAYPLKGKCLNVRGPSGMKFSSNKEFMAFVKIMGLEFGKVYTTTRSLRYGHVMLMTDQDYDGYHIRGLILAGIEKFWPELLALPGFVLEFSTFIKKALPVGAGHKTRDAVCFFDEQRFDLWFEALGPAQRKLWKIRYYKGLGTSTPKEAHAYFKDLDAHTRPIDYDQKRDRPVFELVFEKSQANNRKLWITEFTKRVRECERKGTAVCPPHQGGVPKRACDLLNNEVASYSLRSCRRMLPSAVDGLKEGQRMVLSRMLEKKDAHKTGFKVSTLASDVMRNRPYHHGNVSLENTIKVLARVAVGFSNLTLLVPVGQFGTRHMPDDAASSRYIFTNAHSIAQTLLPHADQPCLEYPQAELDGSEGEGEGEGEENRSKPWKSVQPVHFSPVIPSALAFGCSGLATGWNSYTPPFSPSDLLKHTRLVVTQAADSKTTVAEQLDSTPFEALPFWRGFRGSVSLKSAPGTHPRVFSVSGVVQVVPQTASPDTCVMEVTDLPPRMHTSAFRTWLLNQKFAATFIDLKEYHTDHKVHFVLELPRQEAARVLVQVKKRLTITVSEAHMILFDSKGEITHFPTVNSIFRESAVVREAVYVARKEHTEAGLQQKIVLSSSKSRFIDLVNAEEIVINNASITTIRDQLVTHGFERVGGSFDYLVRMPLYSITKEKADEYRRLLEADEKALAAVRAQSIHDMWLADLDRFGKSLQSYETYHDDMFNEVFVPAKTAPPGKKKPSTKKITKRKRKKRPAKTQKKQ